MSTRRDFLRGLGAGGAVAAASACAPTDPGKLIPYLVPPHDVVPGRAAWYATACRECPAGCGVLARVREGRAVKLEGNPEHPLNGGGLCSRGQAALQGLYNPDRLPGPRRRTRQGLEEVGWDTALDELSTRLQDARVAWVGHHVTGSLDRLIDEFLAGFPASRRVTWEALSYAPLAAAVQRLWGVRRIPSYDLSRAEVVLSFGADFLETWLSNVSLSRQYARAHGYRNGHKGHHIQVSPRRGLTGENADAWLAVSPGSEAAVAAAVLRLVLDSGRRQPPDDDPEPLRRLVAQVEVETVAAQAGIEADRLRALARLLTSVETSAVLGAGASRHGAGATDLETWVLLLNHALGNVGDSVRVDRPSRVGHTTTAAELDELAGGDWNVVFLHHVNPAYPLPGVRPLAEALASVPQVVSLNSHADETGEVADLLLPDHTPLESWGDHTPVAGLWTLQQPVMQPLFDTRSTGDVLLALRAAQGEEVPESFAGYVQERWRERAGGDFDTAWEELRRRGYWENPGEVAEISERLTAPSPPRRLDRQPPTLDRQPPTLDGPADGLTLVLFPTGQWFDGRGANRPWLQELPDPVTKVTWGSWAEVHPDTAARLGLEDGDGIRLARGDGSVELPVVVSDSVHPDAVAVPVGQGHTDFGRYASGRGVNPVALLPRGREPASGSAAWLATRVAVEPLGRRLELLRTQEEFSDRDRHVAREVGIGSVDELAGTGRDLPGLYGDHEHPEHRWAMAIDLDRCTGCGGCEVACAAENNVPVVGPRAVSRGREMAWLRVERYRTGDGSVFLPMLCQHCDQAPCEPVCPVYATYHNPEGLNAMVYNRCVGTRYCSNNCPYKVRRFNWSDHEFPPPLDLQLNPDVTPRSKGVMERCTFCVQRIQAGKRDADRDGRPVSDDDVVPACAQSCPAEAIVFGDASDPDSRVGRLQEDPRGYAVFAELNTRPAVTYLRRVRPVSLSS